MTEEQMKFMNLQELLEEETGSFDRAQEIIWTAGDGCLNLGDKIMAPNPDYEAINLAISEYIEDLHPGVSIPVDVPTIVPKQTSSGNAFDFSQVVNAQARKDYFDGLSCIAAEDAGAAKEIAINNMGNNYFVAMNDSLKDYVSDGQLVQYRDSLSVAPEQGYTEFLDSVYNNDVFGSLDEDKIDEIVGNLHFTGDLERDSVIWTNALDSGILKNPIESGLLYDEGLDDDRNPNTGAPVDSVVVDVDHSAFYNNVYNSKCLPLKCKGMDEAGVDEYLGFDGNYDHDVAIWGSIVARFGMSPFEYGGKFPDILPGIASPLFASALNSKSFDKPQYKAEYGENVISYNVANTNEAVGRINQLLNDFNDDYLERIKEVQTFFSNLSSPYSGYSGIPKLGHSIDSIRDEIKSSYSDWLSKLESIADAIKKYSEGDDLSPLLGDLLSPSNPGGDADGDIPNGDVPAGGEPSGGNPDDDDPGDANPDDDLGGELCDNMNNSSDSRSDDDAKPEIPIINPGTGSPTIDHINSAIPSTFDGSVTPPGDLSLAGNFGTALNSSSNKFLIPSVNSNIGSNFDSNNSNDDSLIIGATGVAAAATFAVGGKLYYDRKKGNDDDNNTNKG